MHNPILSMHVHRGFRGRLLKLTPQKKPGLPGSKVLSDKFKIQMMLLNRSFPLAG